MPVFQAFADGAEIQIRTTDLGWLGTINPQFDNDHKYRIKPKPREFWLNPDPGRGAAVSTEEDSLKPYPNWIKVREVLE